MDNFKLFDTMIKPILCYGGKIWGFEIVVNIQNVHDNFCEKVLKLPPCTLNVFARGECGRFTIYIDYFCRCVKYWVKLTRMNTKSLPYKSYKMLRNLDENGRITWASKVREMLFKYGFGYVWHTENVGDINLFMKIFK